ncbi:MAG: hypothetical protein WBN40_07410, partial [Pseudomonadales bacterium]
AQCGLDAQGITARIRARLADLPAQEHTARTTASEHSKRESAHGNSAHENSGQENSRQENSRQENSRQENKAAPLAREEIVAAQVENTVVNKRGQRAAVSKA